MSVYWTVLAACKAAAEALDLGVTAVEVRKRPFYSADEGDRLPLLCLSFGHERFAEEQFSNGAWVDYPVHLTLFQAQGATLADPAQIQLLLDAREGLRLALFKPELPGAPTVIGCDYDPAPCYDTGGLDRLLDVSCQTFTFRSDEPRSNA